MRLFAYVILENHLHFIALSDNLSKEIGDFKSFTARKLIDLLQTAGAKTLLDQLASMGDKITLALAQTVLGTATSQTVLDIISSIMDHDPAQGLETIHKALDAGADPRSLARQIVEYLRGLMLIQMGNVNQVEATADVKKQMQSHARSFLTSDVLRMMKAFNNAATDLRVGLFEAGEQPAAA